VKTQQENFLNVQNVITGLDDKWVPPTDPLEMVITNPGKI